MARHILALAKTFLPRISRVTVSGGAGTRAASAVAPNGVAFFTVVGDRIVSIDVIATPLKLHRR